MKRVISFSLWGNVPLYIEGAVANVKLRDEFYPGWICRFYVDETTVPSSTLEELSSISDVEIIRMGHAADVLGMYWRFRVMFDDSAIERFIVRDTDSKFHAREAEAVEEWVQSGLPFHIMRDSISHSIPILGGTWGAVPGCIPHFWEMMNSWLSSLIPIQRNPRGLFHGTDQLFLAKCVWPVIKDNHMAHIQRGIENIRFTPNDKYFPSPIGADGHHVGAVW